MTSPDPTAILVQINAAREQVNQTLAQVTSQLALASEQAAAAARDRAAIQAIAQQTVRVDTSVGTRVFAGDTMIHGDTGWRRVDLEPAGSFVLMRRTGSVVEFQLSITADSTASPTATTQTLSGVLPSGFRPTVGLRSLFREGGGIPGKLAFIATAGDVTLYSRTLTERADLMGPVYMTKDAWPATLPGATA